MRRNKVGVWLIGALGSVSTTVLIGALALRKGLIAETGMVTAMEPFQPLNLTPATELEFGGCDIRRGSLHDSAYHLFQETRAIDFRILKEVEEDLRGLDSDIQPGTARHCGDAIESLADRSTTPEMSLLEEVEIIRASLRSFKTARDLDVLVVMNLASTEPPLEIQDFHHDIDAFESRLKANDHQAARASTLYTYAAILEDCPYINFTPSNGGLIPALIQMAESHGVPVTGNDGKTGETLVKSALAPMFHCRNLEILSWEGFNLLGNMDGNVLDHPANCESKRKTKDQVLQNILGYAPHSGVHIHYVPSLDDQKTAWDFVHFKGFLGAKMSCQFVWQGYDSLLAAPLVLDLIRMAELAKRRFESGLMPQLACFFKAPLGVDEHSLSGQFDLLTEYVENVRQESSGKLRTVG
jgi:myo-inositol-1-phosphate synthase